MMVIYADLIFLINAASNYATLLLLGTVIKRRASALRLLAASAAGALGSVLIFCVSNFYILQALLKLCLAVIMTFTAYGKLQLWRTAAIFIFTLYAFSGICLMLISFLRLSSLAAIKNGIIYFDISDKILFAALILGYAAAFAGIGIINRKRRKNIIPLKITLKGNFVTVNALYDSGNLLRDPSSGKSVIIADWDSVQKLFGFEYDELWTRFGELRLNIIPYRSVGNSADTLPVFTADTIEAQGGRIKNMPVGIVPSPLCAKGDYHALIGNIL